MITGRVTSITITIFKQRDKYSSFSTLGKISSWEWVILSAITGRAKQSELALIFSIPADLFELTLFRILLTWVTVISLRVKTVSQSFLELTKVVDLDKSKFNSSNFSLRLLVISKKWMLNFSASSPGSSVTLPSTSKLLTKDFLADPFNDLIVF